MASSAVYQRVDRAYSLIAQNEGSAADQTDKAFLIVHLTHSRPQSPRLGHGLAGGRARHRPRAPAWPWMAAAPVKAPESLTESQTRELDNQESLCF
jgi:hypothetical protein